MGWSSPEYARLAAAIAERTGLTFPDSRQRDTEEALRRALEHPNADAARLHDLLERDSAARDALIASLTIGESYFFRNDDQFTLLRDQLLPDLAADRGDRPLRLWSAGCAAGEEAYSLAILCNEAGLAGSATVLGTDISRTRLAAARRGVYTRWALRGIDDRSIRRYFTASDARYSLRPEYREGVEFRYLNLAEDLYPSLTKGIWGFDIILCRNVLIYFDRDTVAKVARGLIESLSEDGWLLMGASDPALSGLVECEVVLTSAGLAYRRPRVEGASTGSPLLGRPTTAAPRGDPAPWSPVESVGADADGVPDTDDPWSGEHPERIDIAAAGGPPLAQDAAESADRGGTADTAGITQPGAPRPLSVDVTSVEGTAADEPLQSVRDPYAAHDYPRAADRAAELLEERNDPELHVLLIRSLANLGDLQAAGRASAAALERHRGSAELLHLHAVLLQEARHWSEAAAAARRALYLDRSFVVAHLTLAQALSRLGDTAGARRAFRNALGAMEGREDNEVVPASDGETVARLRTNIEAQLRLMESMV